jgi:uncharacterized membrane protein YfcA
MSWIKYGAFLGLIGAIVGALNGLGSFPVLRFVSFPGWFVATLLGKTCVTTSIFSAKCTSDQLVQTVLWVTTINTLVYIVIGMCIGFVVSALKKKVVEEISNNPQPTQALPTNSS